MNPKWDRGWTKTRFPDMLRKDILYTDPKYPDSPILCTAYLQRDEINPSITHFSIIDTKKNRDPSERKDCKIFECMYATSVAKTNANFYLREKGYHQRFVEY